MFKPRNEVRRHFNIELRTETMSKKMYAQETVPLSQECTDLEDNFIEHQPDFSQKCQKCCLRINTGPILLSLENVLLIRNQSRF